MSDGEAATIVKMAIGRLFLLGSRPFQPGDIEQYEDCRRVILANSPNSSNSWEPCYPRDRLKGH